MRILGLDPGLRFTGWGVIEAQDNRLGFVAAGTVASDPNRDLASRLVQLFDGITAVIGEYVPIEAAIEETFVNKNAASALKLGQARGIALLAPARAGLDVFEYAPNLVKKTVVGSGHAAKEQIQMMVRTLLPASAVPGSGVDSADAADALAMAICHAHHRETAQRIAVAVGGKR